MDLYDRSLKNGVPDVELIDGSEIKNYEPYCQVWGYKYLFEFGSSAKPEMLLVSFAFVCFILTGNKHYVLDASFHYILTVTDFL